MDCAGDGGRHGAALAPSGIAAKEVAVGGGPSESSTSVLQIGRKGPVARNRGGYHLRRRVAE